jgi:cell division protein ZapA (FtsZ GTPase activity inhibitor)
MSESVPIVIMGQTFYLRGSHDPAYISRVEQFLNGKIDAVRKAGGTVDTGQLMVLVALNLVDDYFLKERELDALHKNIDNSAAELINLLESQLGTDV